MSFRACFPSRNNATYPEVKEWERLGGFLVELSIPTWDTFRGPGLVLGLERLVLEVLELVEEDFEPLRGGIPPYGLFNEVGGGGIVFTPDGLFNGV